MRMDLRRSNAQISCETCGRRIRKLNAARGEGRSIPPTKATPCREETEELKIVLSPRVAEVLKDAPPAMEKAFGKQIKLLESDLRHPSLRAKKFEGEDDLWQARQSQLALLFSNHFGNLSDSEPHPSSEITATLLTPPYV
jgi:hypothetical protein